MPIHNFLFLIIYNSRNYNGVLNEKSDPIPYQSTIVEIITEY